MLAAFAVVVQNRSGSVPSGLVASLVLATEPFAVVVLTQAASYRLVASYQLVESYHLAASYWLAVQPVVQLHFLDPPSPFPVSAAAETVAAGTAEQVAQIPAVASLAEVHQMDLATTAAEAVQIPVAADQSLAEAARNLAVVAAVASRPAVGTAVGTAVQEHSVVGTAVQAAQILASASAALALPQPYLAV